MAVVLRLKQLEEENRKLKQLVAYLSFNQDGAEARVHEDLCQCCDGERHGQEAEVFAGEQPGEDDLSADANDLEHDGLQQKPRGAPAGLLGEVGVSGCGWGVTHGAARTVAAGVAPANIASASRSLTMTCSGE